jgi:hypothetical protein
VEQRRGGASDQLAGNEGDGWRGERARGRVVEWECGQGSGAEGTEVGAIAGGVAPAQPMGGSGLVEPHSDVAVVRAQREELRGCWEWMEWMERQQQVGARGWRCRGISLTPVEAGPGWFWHSRASRAAQDRTSRASNVAGLARSAVAPALGSLPRQMETREMYCARAGRGLGHG